MGTKTMIWLGIGVGSTVGGWLGSLFGGGLLGWQSLLGGTIGSLAGVWLGYKATQYIGT